MSIGKKLIELEYQNSYQCARDLENCARVIKSVASSDIGEMISDISMAWKGDSADVCVRKTVVAQEDVKKDGENIERTAAVIRMIADNVRRAEITAYNLTHIRKY